MNRAAKEIVGRLELAPHPEGGWYREIFRSTRRVEARFGGATVERAASTAIWFLLGAGERSRWHRLASDETWTHAAGGAIELFVLDPADGDVRRRLVGPLGPESEPVAVVPAGCWQAARPTGDFALATCFVAPGFEFADFSLAAGDPVAEESISRLAPELIGLL